MLKLGLTEHLIRTDACQHFLLARASMGFEEMLSLDCLAAGLMFFAVDQFPRAALCCVGSSVRAVVPAQTIIYILRVAYV